MALLSKGGSFAVWAAGYGAGIAIAGLIVGLENRKRADELALARAEVIRLQLEARMTQLEAQPWQTTGKPFPLLLVGGDIPAGELIAGATE